MVYIRINLEGKEVLDIFRWCDDQYGPDNWTFQQEFPSTYWLFYLPNEEAVTWFKLTWQ